MAHIAPFLTTPLLRHSLTMCSCRSMYRGMSQAGCRCCRNASNSRSVFSSGTWISQLRPMAALHCTSQRARFVEPRRLIPSSLHRSTSKVISVTAGHALRPRRPSPFHPANSQDGYSMKRYLASSHGVVPGSRQSGITNSGAKNEDWDRLRRGMGSSLEPCLQAPFQAAWLWLRLGFVLLCGNSKSTPQADAVNPLLAFIHGPLVASKEPAEVGVGGRERCAEGDGGQVIEMIGDLIFPECC